MICDTVREQLDALADGELSPWSAWRMRRHLAHCPDCAAELTATHRLTERVRAWRCVSTPAGLAASLPAHLPTHPRRVRLAWRPALACAGCIGAASAAVLFLPGQPAHPTVTFADVEKAMAQVKTISSQNWCTQYDTRRRVIWEEGVLIWARADPPATVAVYLPVPGQPYPPSWGRSHGGKVLDDWHGQEDVSLPPHDYHIYSLSRQKGMESAKYLLGVILNGLTNPKSYDYGYTFSGEKPGRVVNDGITTLDGRRLLKFTRTMGGNGVGMIWIDPATKFVCCEESIQHYSSGDKVTITKNIRYNAAPPPGIFDWKTPPSGAHIKVTVMK